ncbi:cytidine deaminase [Saccharopolyspora rhizosphaerae]|uniref:cytidine deaminase n=1 Tax=Saccharopolyspora rhizosphaerae TaxID=2492662 RepID=UPI0018F5E094|nr:cytidine deaminase [Saccharopolyspora rhizosphaerae]
MVSGELLERTAAECRRLIADRFPGGGPAGAAAMLLDDGTVLTGTGPDPINPSTNLCHEVEPYCAAHRLDRAIVASICLHRAEDGSHLVLSPCGICRERLADHGPDVLVAVPGPSDPTEVQWLTLREALPRHWAAGAFPEDVPQWA